MKNNIIFLFLFPIVLLGQNVGIKDTNNVLSLMDLSINVSTLDHVKDMDKLYGNNGYDSLGRKQGEWWEEVQNEAAYFGFNER